MPDEPMLTDQLTEEEAVALKQRVVTRLWAGKNYWRPLHARMDMWINMYLMLDVVQQSKPLGIRRFISNDPRTAVDAAVSILTRNPIGWKIDELGAMDENQEELEKLGKIQRTLVGVGYELDELMSMRLLPSWRVRQAQQALLRGAIWGKVHVTNEALDHGRSAPIQGEIYDSRTVYPHNDAYGLGYVIIENITTLGDLVDNYPEAMGRYNVNDPNFNPNIPALKIEYWSNDRGLERGVTGVLAIVGAQAQTGWTLIQLPEAASSSEWLIPPYRHGYDQDSLPVFGVMCNGLSIQSKPALGTILDARLTERADLLALNMNQWHGPQTWIAELGRSILSSVEELVPQYNELVATIFQYMSIGTYPTWVFQNPTGEQPDWKPGLNSVIALKPEESVNAVQLQPISPDAYRLLQVLQQEKERGILSSILQAVSPQAYGSAVLFQQLANAALNAVEPFRQGMIEFGTRMATSVLAQLKQGKSAFKKFELTGNDRNSYFRIEFDPSVDLDDTRKYRPVPVMRPALPDDITIRLTAARMALDPKKPILSLTSVLEVIMQWDDPAGEKDRIWNDMAEMEPVIMLERIAVACDKRGEPELAARIRHTEFQTGFVKDMQFRQATGTAGTMPGDTSGATGGPPPEGGGMTPEQTSAAQGADIMASIGGGGAP
jgi:hypothetical protein